MIISPCGWFSVDEPEQWEREDTPRGIVLHNWNMGGSIEITSARRKERCEPELIMELHEIRLKELGLPIQETNVEQLANGVQVIHSLALNAQQFQVEAHLFWSCYCAEIRLDSPLDSEAQERMNDFKNLLESIQPLTVD